jgi:hypothetical protein
VVTYSEFDRFIGKPNRKAVNSFLRMAHRRCAWLNANVTDRGNVVLATLDLAARSPPSDILVPEVGAEVVLVGLDGLTKDATEDRRAVRALIDRNCL